MLQGGLFTRDWLTEGIRESAPWQALDESTVQVARTALRKLLHDLLRRRSPVEAETEDKLVYPVLRLLGWASPSFTSRSEWTMKLTGVFSVLVIASSRLRRSSAFAQ